MKTSRKITSIFAITAAVFGGALVAAPAAIAAPVGSCSSGPYWDNSIVSGVASCNGSYWRVNVECVNNSKVYGAWGGPRTAVTRHSGCRDNWFVTVTTQ